MPRSYSCGSPLTVRLRPAPKSASMISAGLPTACGFERRIGYFHPLPPRLRRPRDCPGRRAGLTETSRPRANQFSRRDKTVAPLLPPPATTRMGPCSTRSMAASATAWPALIIRAKPGVPAAMVSRSARSISEVVRNFHAKFPIPAPYPEASYDLCCSRNLWRMACQLSYLPIR